MYNKKIYKILITGATGFIGQCLVDQLLKNGLDEKSVELFVLARDITRINPEWKSQITVLEGTLQDLGLHYKEVCQECDFVFHLAAKASLNSSGDFSVDNVMGTQVLIDALQGSHNLRRIIFTSTIGAVDRQKNDSCQEPLTEISAPNPLSDYGKSKLAAENLIKNSQLPYVIIRPTWVYGPGMRSNSHIRVFISMAEKRSISSRLLFPGKVSLIYVDDLIKSLLLVALEPKALGQTYFVSDRDAITIGDLFNLIYTSSCRNEKMIKPPLFLFRMLQKFRPYLPLSFQNLASNVLWADSQKIAALGFSPKENKNCGILKTIRWHNQQKNNISPNEKCLITGAASGIGEAFARKLYTEGYSLLLVDKNPKVEQLAQELESEFQILDLTSVKSLVNFEEFLDQQKIVLNLVINNAGIGTRGKVVDLPFDLQQNVINLNCIAATFVSRLSVRNFIKYGKGNLINIISSSAFQPLPFMAVYAASKAYFLSFSRALSSEMESYSEVKILTVSPSGTATNFQSSAGVKRRENEKLLSPFDIANVSLNALEQGKKEIVVGLSGQLMELAGKLIPVSLQKKIWYRLMSAQR
jgi:uncharacterized protein